MRKLLAVMASLVLLFSAGISSAEATHAKFNGNWFQNSVIADGVLLVCFEAGTPVETNRSAIATGYNRWSTAAAAGPIRVTFQSLAGCNGSDFQNANIIVEWEPLGNCASLIGQAPLLGSANQKKLQYNSNCSLSLHWSTATGGVPNGFYSGQAIAFHEMGHVLGLAHENDWAPVNGFLDVMDAGMGGCIQGQALFSVSAYDGSAMKERYAGLAANTSYGNNSACLD